MFWMRRKTVELPERHIPACIDCRHIRPDTSRYLDPHNRLLYAKCGHPNAGYKDRRHDLVTGNPDDRDHNHCSVERGEYRSLPGHCGPEGNNFEPMFLDLQPESSESHPIPLMIETNKKELDIAELPHYSRVHRIQH